MYVVTVCPLAVVTMVSCDRKNHVTLLKCVVTTSDKVRYLRTILCLEVVYLYNI